MEWSQSKSVMDGSGEDVRVLFRARRARRPAFMAQRNLHPQMQTFRLVAPVHLSVQLTLNHRLDQARAEAAAPEPPRPRSLGLDPVKKECRAAIRVGDRPRDFDPAGGFRQASVLDG